MTKQELFERLLNDGAAYLPSYLWIGLVHRNGSQRLSALRKVRVRWTVRNGDINIDTLDRVYFPPEDIVLPMTAKYHDAAVGVYFDTSNTEPDARLSMSGFTLQAGSAITVEPSVYYEEPDEVIDLYRKYAQAKRQKDDWPF